LRELIARHGWPSEDKAGEDGAEAGWLIAQHAIGEPEFQRRALQWVRESADQGRTRHRKRSDGPPAFGRRSERPCRRETATGRSSGLLCHSPQETGKHRTFFACVRSWQR
jgi:hypothetical protein